MAQEVFLQVYRALPQYRSQGFKTWLSRISLHKAIDYKRRLNRIQEVAVEQVDEVMEQSHDSPYPVPEDQDVLRQVILKDEKERMLHWLSKLPDQHREVIHAFYVEDKSHEQIAVECGVAVKTVESRLYRARDWIRKHDKEGWQ